MYKTLTNNQFNINKKAKNERKRNGGRKREIRTFEWVQYKHTYMFAKKSATRTYLTLTNLYRLRDRDLSQQLIHLFDPYWHA